MATCRDCFHWEACKAMFEASGGIIVADDFKGSSVRCKYFVSTADVAPRAEVELWKGRTEAVFAAIPETRREFARKIFGEVRNILNKHYYACYQHEDGDECDAVISYLSYVAVDFDRLEQKYTEAETEPPKESKR